MSNPKMKTMMAKENEVSRRCFLIDAKNKILGRVAAKAAVILRGKHKPQFTPHVDTGDMVVIINAENINVTGEKRTQKIYQRYSGYPSGQKRLNFETLFKKSPTTVIRHAVEGMIPKGILGDRIKKKLRIYRDANHPHQAQKPIALMV